MGNIWKGISDDAYYASEKKMLGYSGIPYNKFKISNVVIDSEGNFIRTIEVGDKSK